MKRLTIGRNPNCDIMFDQNMVSRNHALLNIYPSGKYEIVNMGTNGTTVNGVQISTGQPYPVKRGDTIVFAGQCALDWKDVPNPAGPWKTLLLILGGAAVVGLLVWGIIWATNRDWSSDDSEFVSGGSNQVEQTAPGDTTNIDNQETPADQDNSNDNESSTSDNKGFTSGSNTSDDNSSSATEEKTDVDKKSDSKSLIKTFFPNRAKNDSEGDGKDKNKEKNKKKNDVKSGDSKKESKPASRPKNNNDEEEDWHR